MWNVRQDVAERSNSDLAAGQRRQGKPRGVFVPALTPFRADLSVDATRFVAHCRWLLDEGADGLAVFGTTSEANSLQPPSGWRRSIA